MNNNIETKILATYDSNEGKNYIIDEINNDNPEENTRSILLEDIGCHSKIYLSPNKTYLPLFPLFLRFISMWYNIHKITQIKSLILGCAGCSFPRFLLNKYLNSYVTGIEYDLKMIKIANKFFLDNLDMNRFMLILGDAFEYIKEEHKYNLIFVDLYDGYKLIKGVAEKEFIENLNNISTNESLILFNTLYDEVSNNKIYKYGKKYFNVFTLDKDDNKFIFLIKTKKNISELINLAELLDYNVRLY